MEKNIDLVSNPKKSFWKLSIPLIGFCVFDAIYGIVDMVWVSKISIEAFYALGVSIPLVSLILSFGNSIGSGTNSIMSRFIGSNDYESAYNALIHGLLLGNAIWLFTVFSLLFAHGILFYINKADSYILVFDYLVPIVVFAYILILNNILAATLQAEGDSRLPTIVMIASNILNIILDPIFIFNWNLGIKGAAYATVLSALLGLIPLLYFYFDGRTKVPLSPKYFKFHTYIFVEILKVAFPNFIDSGAWCFNASFINYILITTMGPIGPILYSSVNKFESIITGPAKGSGSALMSITGHLFGAEKFDDLHDMYMYILKITTGITIIIMIICFFLRGYIASLFSITGMETEVFWIAIGGIIFMTGVPCSMISSRILDGLGKSPYSLLFTVIFIVFETILIYALFILLSDARSILIGLVVSEIFISLTYFLFVKYLFKNLNQKYKGKGTVKNYNNPNKLPHGLEEEIDDIIERESRKIPKRIPLIFATIAMIVTALEIISIPIKIQNYPLFIFGIISLIIALISIYFIKKLNKLSIIGFLMASLITLVFMGRYGYFSTLLFIITAFLLIYSKKIIKKLR